MTNYEDEIIHIIYQSFLRKLNKQEKEKLTLWLSESEKRKQWYSELTNDATKLSAYLKHYHEAINTRDKTWEIIKNGISPNYEDSKPNMLLFFQQYWRIAASILLIIGLSFYVYTIKDPENKASLLYNVSVEQNNGTYLTTEDGKKINLEDQDKDNQGNMINLSRAEMDKITSSTRNNNLELRSIQTSAGKQVHFELEDGTLVWLNTNSTIIFPKKFNNTERKVKIIGEVYFEVASDPTKPFLVDVDDKNDIKVLGTKFNVQAYPENRNIKTSLIEGSIRLSTANMPEGPILLKPGNQAIYQEASKTKTNNKNQFRVQSLVNPASTIAWKSGVFSFDDKTLKDILIEIGRWYQINIWIKGEVPDKLHLNGEISNEIQLLDLLDALKPYGITYQLKKNNLELKLNTSN